MPGKAPLHPNTNLRPSTKPIDWSKLDSSSFEPSAFSGEIQAPAYVPVPMTQLTHEASPLLVDSKKASPF